VTSDASCHLPPQLVSALPLACSSPFTLRTTNFGNFTGSSSPLRVFFALSYIYFATIFLAGSVDDAGSTAYLSVMRPSIVPLYAPIDSLFISHHLSRASDISSQCRQFPRQCFSYCAVTPGSLPLTKASLINGAARSRIQPRWLCRHDDRRAEQ